MNTGIKIATLDDRFIALFWDYLIWWGTTIIFAGIFAFALPNLFIHYYLMYVTALLFLFKDINGASFGKKRKKLKIVKVKDNSKSPNFLLLALRNMLLWIWIFDMPFIFFNNQNRRLGDIIAGSIVIKQQ